MNNLIGLIKQKQENIMMNCKLNREIVNGVMKMNQRSFNLIFT